MNLVNQINQYLKVFLTEPLDERSLSEIQQLLFTAIEKSSPVELITAISMLEPRIDYLDRELNARELELTSRNSKLNTDSADFDQIAKDRGISRGELLVALGNKINEIKAKQEKQYNSACVLRAWLGNLKVAIQKKLATLSEGEKLQLYDELNMVVVQNEEQMNLLDNEIAHRELQTDEEIQQTATKNGKTFNQVKYGIEFEIMQKKMEISTLEAQNNVISRYQTPLVPNNSDELRKPR